jgi:hypothetical protein
MQHEQIVHEHLQGEFYADTHQAAARKAPSAPMCFAICTDACDCLTASPLHPLGFCRLHPGPVRHDDLCVFAAPKAPAAFLARGALRP